MGAGDGGGGTEKRCEFLCVASPQHGHERTIARDERTDRLLGDQLPTATSM